MSEAAVQEISTEDLNRASERARERLEPLVAPLQASYAEILREAGERMARSFSSKAIAITAAGKEFVPPDEDEVVSSEETKKAMLQRSRDAQEEASVEVGIAFEEEGIAFDIEQVFTEDLLEAIGERAAFAADEEMREVYRGVIADAAEEGWSVSRAAEEIVAKVEGLADFRAEALARTDLNGLANGASVHVATKTVGKVETVYKTWLATADERTRDSHMEADGQSVPVNDYFTVGGAPLSYPGDPFGPSEEVMNCRCTVTYGSEPGSTVIRAGAHTARAMPYHIEERDDEFCVIKDDDDEVMGCHDTRQEAEDQIAAIEANEEASVSTITADGTVTEIEPRRLQTVEPVPFDSVLCVEGVETEDGRLLERGSIAWRDLPLTMMGMLKHEGFGHAGAQVAGRIDSIFRSGDNVSSDGELTSRFGVEELAGLIEDRTVRGVSVDLAVLDYEYRDPDSGEVLSDDEAFERWWMGEPMLFVVLEGIIVGATICPMPAIANASIAIAASAGLGEQGRNILASALEGGKLGPFDVPIISVFTPFDRKAQSQSLFASAVQFSTEAPPRSHFEISEFPGKTPLTVTDDGRVFGHIATWDTCHVGIPGVCTMAPRSKSGYAYFHTGEWPVAEGGTVDVGKLMLGTGHAQLSASRMEATRHYDKPDMVGAYVRAHDGEHGIWVSGVVRPELSGAGLRELRANPPSGDWRQAAGALELIAVCAVAVPGFPVPRADANITASAGELGLSALIASSGIILPTETVKEALIAAGCECEDLETVPEGVDELLDLAD